MMRELTDNVRRAVNLARHGFVLVPDPRFVRHVERTVTRTWKERLCGWPWKPWIEIRIEVETEPIEELMIMIEHRMVIAHPSVIERARRKLGLCN